MSWFRYFVIALSAAFVTSGCTAQKSSIAVSPDIANKTLHQRFQIPESATRVSFVTSLRDSTVEVDISQSDFLKWCDAMGWRCEEITEDRPGAIVSINSEGVISAPTLVLSGLRFDASDDESGFVGVFDAATGKANVVYLVR
jgi:hypothetical protein